MSWNYPNFISLKCISSNLCVDSISKGVGTIFINIPREVSKDGIFGK